MDLFACSGATAAPVATIEVAEACLLGGPPWCLLSARTDEKRDVKVDPTGKAEQLTVPHSALPPGCCGHLATTCPKAAGEWGIAASIWPIGEDGVHFAWFADGGLFWPRPEGASQDVIVDGRDCGQMSLEDALVGDNWEVLFQTEKFVAIPVKFEDELCKELKKSFVI